MKKFDLSQSPKTSFIDWSFYPTSFYDMFEAGDYIVEDPQFIHPLSK